MNYQETLKEFQEVLFGNFVPFWEKFSPDKEYGGYLCGFGRDGELFYEDKSVWQQGRSLWSFSKLYNEFGGKKEWLDCAKCGYDFINKYCFAPSGHMYFRVTREGKPLVERRYYFSEAFAVMGYVEYYKATGIQEVKQRAIDLFDKMLTYYTTPDYFPAKVNPETRINRGHSIVMIMLNVAQNVREIDDNPKYDEVISDCIHTLTTDFIKPEYKALFETVGKNGEMVNSPEGRLINPGHSLETAWFLMKEAVHRKDKELMETAMQVTLWSLERGWDKEMGGIFYFCDVENKPVTSLEWDMKLFWPHCEGMIALLYAYKYSGEQVYYDWFEKLKTYAFEHFSDEGHPEWVGYLHRDGTPVNYIKGCDWKGCFHNVRAFMLITQLLESIDKGEKFDF